MRITFSFFSLLGSPSSDYRSFSSVASLAWLGSALSLESRLGRWAKGRAGCNIMGNMRVLEVSMKTFLDIHEAIGHLCITLESPSISSLTIRVFCWAKKRCSLAFSSVRFRSISKVSQQ